MTMNKAISDDFPERVAAASQLPLDQREAALEALYQELAAALDSSAATSSSNAS